MNSNLPKTGEESKAIIYLVGGLVLIVLVFKFGKQILDAMTGSAEALGLKDSKEGAENKRYIDNSVNTNNAAGTKSPWSPLFYKAVQKRDGKVVIFTESSAKDIAKRFYDSVGYIYDSPALGVSAVKQIPTKVKLSHVSDIFNRTYKIDLLTWLNDKYDKLGQREYLREILEYADNLPEK